MSRPSSTRTLLVLLLLLFAGAMINVGVAWGLAIWMPTYPGSSVDQVWRSAPGPDGMSGWIIIRRDNFGASRIIASVNNTPYSSATATMPPPPAGRTSIVAIETLNRPAAVVVPRMMLPLLVFGHSKTRSNSCV